MDRGYPCNITTGLEKVWRQSHPLRHLPSRKESPDSAAAGFSVVFEGYALDKLQALRDRLGKPLIVRSAYRSPEHNSAVGGATRSKHFDGAAFGIAMVNHGPVAFEAVAREVGFLGFGFYPRSGFIHVDLGPTRSGASGFRSGRPLSRPKPRQRAKWSRTAAP